MTATKFELGNVIGKVLIGEKRSGRVFAVASAFSTLGQYPGLLCQFLRTRFKFRETLNPEAFNYQAANKRSKLMHFRNSQRHIFSVRLAIIEIPISL